MSQLPNAPLTPQDTELYDAFFQDRYYLKKQQAMAHEGKGISFNGWAFFFGIMWFLHRRMYVEAAIVLAVKIAYEISEENLKTGAVADDGFLMSIGETLIFSIVMGYVANPIYISKARRAVARAKRLYPDTTHQKIYLQREGGTAGAVPVILGFIMLMLIYLYDFIMN